ncbi:restriction of telomere capping protein 5 [[Candida] railenensis]|uniref:Restriction of telomere capping protein 5 n=1 Tax=[Candida] railenensis TaxID=45579 RepID=A0A9P0VYD4_9ASCO|nr:restriction of telomere capping protein 5 [[Candida] railenensis]
MGQGTSKTPSPTTVQSKADGSNLESFTKSQIIDSFYKTCLSTVASYFEIKSLLTKLNIVNLEDQPISRTDLLGLFKLPEDVENEEYSETLNFLFESLKVLGKSPFIADYRPSDSSPITTNTLIISAFFHSHTFEKVLPDYDYLKLLFISLCLADSTAKKDPASEANEKVTRNVEKKASANFTEIHIEDPYVCEVHGEDKQIQWLTVKSIQTFDEIDITKLRLKWKDLTNVITLLLFILSMAIGPRDDKDVNLYWAESVKYASSMVKYLDLDQSADVTFPVFKSGIERGFPKFFQRGFQLFFSGLLDHHKVKAVEVDKEPKVETGIKKSGAKFPKFKPSKLLSYSTIAFLSSISLKLSNSMIFSPQNLVKLYSGSEAGFSIRSLESKIFKWQAPTIFLVSGKRLKNKTITTNKRYQQFNDEFPRYFRSHQEAKRPWQSDNDKITYAVVVSQPWRISNKKNFGDENCFIVSIEPHFDVYQSQHNPVLKGQSCYFNTLGLGIGFGNDQPINKNGVKKYLPGDVSLTIESNLEFAVFRHTVTPSSSNSSRYFDKSNQAQLSQEDFEDRFMITDLEVWGVGSMKELEEQKRQWEWEAKQAEARQSVNINSLGEERAFLEMVGLVGNRGSGGSI